MLFGLRNVLATFQRQMDIIFLSDEINFVFLYINDLKVLSKNEGYHMNHHIQLIQTYIKASIKLDTEKCSFFQKKSRIQEI